MRKLHAGSLLLATAALLSGTIALACGDHLLAIGRGLRFQHAYAPRQGNLVIYSSATPGAAALVSKKLQTRLRQAGHKLQAVETVSQLDQVLKSGKVDVVLADFAELGEIARELHSAPSNPIMLPVLFKPTKAELAAAQREYKVAVKAPADEVQYLTAIDEAMKLRLRSGAKS